MEKDLHFLIHNMMTIFIHLLKHSGGQSCVVKSKKKKSYSHFTQGQENVTYFLAGVLLQQKILGIINYLKLYIP